MLVKDVIQIGALKFPLNEGDIVDTAEQDEIAEAQAGGGTTLTGVKVANGKVRVSGNAGAVNTTLPTADQIVAALRGGLGTDVPPVNSPYDTAHNSAPEKEFPSNAGVITPRATFRFTLINGNVGAANLVAQASSGVSLVGTVAVAANKWREWIVRVLSSAPTIVASASTTNASKVLSNISAENINRIQVGQSVFGAGIGAAAVVTAVNRDAKTVSVSVDSTATADNIAVTFTPTVSFTNLRAGDI